MVTGCTVGTPLEGSKANKPQLPLVSFRTPIRDLGVVVGVDQLQGYINDCGLYEILNQVQDDTIANFKR